jgi:chorismate mutase
MTALAYIPFVQPLNALQDWWYLLLVPLAFGIAVIYKALRLRHLEHFWRHVAVMTAQIVLAMIGLAICLAVLVQVLRPRLPQ